MRLVLTAVLMLTGSSAALASSITTISGSPRSEFSVTDWICTDCPAIKPPTQVSSYKVPTLEKGAEKTEIIEINGQKKLARTEAWFGGSPVIFVTKVPEWLAKDKSVADLDPKNGSTEAELDKVGQSHDGIDPNATTGALAPLPVAAPAQPVPLATSGLDLRLAPIQ